MARRAFDAGYWILPSILCFIVYWHALHTWFTNDDFLWLQLPGWIHTWSGAREYLLQPTVHGTWRPISERLYFYLFSSLFGLNALPFKLWAFFTYCASLLLLSDVTFRITGSRLAGFLAPIFWVANSSIAYVMAWTAAYMQILAGFMILLALHYLLRWIETGKLRYYVYQWIVFLIGFGVLETNAVYPALAAGCTLLVDRKRISKVLPLLFASLLFAVLHALYIPKSASGPYAIHVDASMLNTFWEYVRLCLKPAHFRELTGLPNMFATAAWHVALVALIPFTLFRALQRDWIPALCAAGFCILLAPMLPLRDHILQYLVFLPAIPIAMLFGYALAVIPRGAAVLLGLVWIVPGIITAFDASRWYRQDAANFLRIGQAVARSRQQHPSDVIVLQGAGDNFVLSAMKAGLFQALKLEDVYLMPGGLEPYAIPASGLKTALDNDQAVVLDVSAPIVNDVTEACRNQMRTLPDPGLPASIQMQNAFYDRLLGEGWYWREGGIRWMSAQSRVRISGPRMPAEKLHLRGFCPVEQTRAGPLTLTIEADHIQVAAPQLAQGGVMFDLAVNLPAQLVGKPSVDYVLRVNRTITVSGDPRTLGLAFASIETR